MPDNNLSILQVENNSLEAELFQEMLMQEFGQGNYTITHVKTLAKALRALKKTSFSLILLDLDLDDSQGIQNVTAIKQVVPDLPIVVLSSRNDNQIALEAIREGAQEYVVKSHLNSRVLGLTVLSSIERKRYERELFRQANHDELTGLANRRMFSEFLRRQLVRADRWQRKESLFFVDVDNFKSINDKYGHDIGNEYLQQIATRLKKSLRASDMVARYAGDEFVIHMDLAADFSIEALATIANKIKQRFSKPIIIGDKKLSVSLSIGIAIYPQHGDTYSTLLANADQAMYLAKKQPGTSFMIFQPE